MNIRKGDTVLVLAGKDRGSAAWWSASSAPSAAWAWWCPGINMAKRHQRPRSRTQQAGILDLPVPLHLSNVQVVCPRCDKPTRISHQLLEDGTKRVRVCKHCGEQMEVAQ